ncbi:hypothetical protein RI367_008595 [Sorochytrium milnesiophthora]
MSILLFLTLLLLVSRPCVAEAELEAIGCDISVDFTRPPQPQLPPVHPTPDKPNDGREATQVILGLASTVIGLLPGAGPFIAAGIAFTQMMIGTEDGSAMTVQDTVNQMSRDIVRWAEEMVAHEFIKKAIRDMKSELGTLTERFRRMQNRGYTDDGYFELTALHLEYLDHVETFIPDFSTEAQSYYENFMTLTQTYCLSYVVVARLYIDARKHKVEQECGLHFPSPLRLSPTYLNDTKLIKRGDSDAGAKCQRAQNDLASAFNDVANHLARVQTLLKQRVVPTLQAKYFGAPFDYWRNYQEMQRAFEDRAGTEGEYDRTTRSTSVSLHWHLQNKWNNVVARDVQCRHPLSAAFTCVVKGSSSAAVVVSNLRRNLLAEGEHCLEKLEQFAMRYELGPKPQVQRFIQDAVIEYIKVIQNATDTIAEDRSATNRWLAERPNE